MLPTIIAHIGLTIVIYYLSIVVHELGHVAAGRFAGYQITSVGMGLSRPLVWFRATSTVYYLALGSPFQGITFGFQPRLLTTHWRNIVFLSGGFLANMLAACVAAICFQTTSWSYAWGLAAIINGLTGFLTLMPIAVKVQSLMLYSDGAQILALLQGRRLNYVSLLLIQSSGSLQKLWRRIGDANMYYYCGVNSAAVAMSLNDIEESIRLMEDAEQVVDNVHPQLRALGRVIQAITLIAQRDFENAEQRIAEADAGFAQLEHSCGGFFTSLAHAEIQLERGNLAAAREHLERMVVSVPSRECVYMRGMVELWLRIRDPECNTIESVEAAHADYEIIRQRAFDVDDFRCYRDLNECYRQLGADRRIVETAHKALRIGRAILKHISWPKAREVVQQKCDELTSASQAAWNRLDKPDKEAFRRIGIVEPTQQKAEDQSIVRSWRTWNMMTTLAGLANALAGLLILVGMIDRTHSYESRFALMSAGGVFLLTAITISIGGALILLIAWLRNRHCPRPRTLIWMMVILWAVYSGLMIGLYANIE